MHETAYRLNTQIGNIPAARLDASEAAKILGFEEHDIRVLVAKKLLKPLGKPNQSATKYFSWQAVLGHAHDERWLGHATQSLYEYWSGKNAKRKKAQEDAISFPA